MANETTERLREQVGEAALLYGEQIVGWLKEDLRVVTLEHVRPYIMLLDAYNEMGDQQDDRPERPDGYKLMYVGKVESQ